MNYYIVILAYAGIQLRIEFNTLDSGSEFMPLGRSASSGMTN